MISLTITLTPQELDTIGLALGQRPFAEVEALINKLRAQFQTQQDLPEPVARAAPEA